MWHRVGSKCQFSAPPQGLGPHYGKKKKIQQDPRLAFLAGLFKRTNEIRHESTEGHYDNDDPTLLHELLPSIQGLLPVLLAMTSENLHGRGP